MNRVEIDTWLARLDATERCRELELENQILRFQRDRQILTVAQLELADDIRELHAHA